MKSISVDQALYGYADGHRLLTSSRKISGSAGRLLRAISDMGFEDPSRSYLTCLPIKELKTQALIRTWPDPASARPGSVWSHVLLVDFVDLGHLDSLVDLVELFMRPDRAEGAGWTERYSRSVEFGSGARPAKKARRLDESLAAELVRRVYASDEPVSLVADTDRAEQVLLAMMEQQWPRLRRSFSFRTRNRSAVSPSASFDIEVVEHARRSSADPVSETRWADLLTNDLMMGGGSLREALRLYGAESDAGRPDMRRLASVVAQSQTDQASTTVLDCVCQEFPDRSTMRRLKRDLLGPAGGTQSTIRRWPTGDIARLALILEAPRPCFDIDDLDFEKRLEAAWRASPAELTAVIARAPIEEMASDQLDAVVSVTASEASVDDVAKLAERSPELALLVVGAKPVLAESSAIWSIADLRPPLLDVLAAAGRDAQTRALVALIDGRQADAAADLCSLDASLWWAAFNAIAQRHRPASNKSAAHVEGLKTVLELVGPAAVGGPPQPLDGYAELLLLAEVSTPTSGLWRSVGTDAWLAIVEEIKLSARRTSEMTRFRVFAIALASATRSGSSSTRRRAWLATFGPLHSTMELSGEPEEDWALLEPVVPKSPAWDRCGRLRQAAVETAIRDRWAAADIEQLVASVPEYGPDLAAALRDREEKRKKSRGWLLDFVDGLFS